MDIGNCKKCKEDFFHSMNSIGGDMFESIDGYLDLYNPLEYCSCCLTSLHKQLEGVVEVWSK